MVFSLFVSPLVGLPGAVFTFTVAISDINGANMDVLLTLEGKAHDSTIWQANPSVPPQTIHIDANGNATTTFTWTTQSNLPIGKYDARVKGQIGTNIQYTSEASFDISTTSIIPISLQEIVNSLEYLRTRGFVNPEEASLYVVCKKWLNSTIQNPEEIISYLNNTQQADGSWPQTQHSEMFTTHRVLLSYYLLNSTPGKSLEPFMSNYNTLPEVLNYVALHDVRNVYHVVFGWCLYYWKYPSWLNDLYAYIEQDLSWTTTSDDYHKTTHVLYSYIISRRAWPNLDGIIDEALSLQQSDGSWPPMFSRPVYSTSIMISMLSEVLALYPGHRTVEIQNALARAAGWVSTQYRTQVIEGVTCGYFGELLNIEDSLFCGILSAGQTELLAGSNVDMTFADVYNRLQTDQDGGKTTRLYGPLGFWLFPLITRLKTVTPGLYNRTDAVLTNLRDRMGK